MRKVFFSVALLFLSFFAHAEEYVSSLDDTVNVRSERKHVLHPSDEFNKARFYGVTGGLVGTWGITLVGLNELWYKDYPRTSFQFFDDSREWLQVDKAGHIYNAYYMSRFGIGLYRWAGLDEKKAVWIGGMTGTFLLSAVEILDGFSVEWGFSISDFGANMLGSALVISQELAWQEQRISVKLSAFPAKYPEGVLRERADELFGSGLHEMVLKDYNSITGWLSVNPAAFMKNKPDRMPGWLNIAVGYGASGMYGGFENRWCTFPGHKYADGCPENYLMDYSHVPRVRHFYLSPDIDFSRISSNSPLVRTLLEVLNIVKLPAPTLEYNSAGNLRWHWLFF